VCYISDRKCFKTKGIRLLFLLLLGNTRDRKPKEQSRMDNPETLETMGTQDKGKQSITKYKKRKS
jgi:hypothetical protein